MPLPAKLSSAWWLGGLRCPAGQCNCADKRLLKCNLRKRSKEAKARLTGEAAALGRCEEFNRRKVPSQLLLPISFGADLHSMRTDSFNNPLFFCKTKLFAVTKTLFQRMAGLECEDGCSGNVHLDLATEQGQQNTHALAGREVLRN
jgi:hypothetical protein